MQNYKIDYSFNDVPNEKAVTNTVCVGYFASKFTVTFKVT